MSKTLTAVDEIGVVAINGPNVFFTANPTRITTRVSGVRWNPRNLLP
jgi:hypothetical protein